MKKVVCILIVVMAIAGYALFSSGEEKPAIEKAVAKTLLVQVNDFSDFITNKFEVAATSDTPDEKQLQQLFLQARNYYKKFEWAAEYFDAATTRSVNGAPVSEVEVGSGQIFDPAGLQVIEGILYPKYDASRKQELLQQLHILQLGCNKYKTYFTNIDIFDWQVFDAAKLEVFRI
ncbi:MAG: hypothetical protein AAGC65_13070, partial [Mucilaginibacter sp.]|uniref:hypothetical protein n=1 Tax=Mucilaginibacter sp. TaxID=1882438 RepID=UPI00319FB014